jgi:hypothetical protein
MWNCVSTKAVPSVSQVHGAFICYVKQSQAHRLTININYNGKIYLVWIKNLLASNSHQFVPVLSCYELVTQSIPHCIMSYMNCFYLPQCVQSVTLTLARMCPRGLANSGKTYWHSMSSICSLYAFLLSKRSANVPTYNIQQLTQNM